MISNIINKICKQVAILLEIENSQVNVDNPLSALGMDSLIAAQLQYYIIKEFSITIPLDQLIWGISIKQIATQICTESACQFSEIFEPLESSEGVLPYLLSYEQQRLWALNELYPNNPTYNISVYADILGCTSIDRLKKAIDLTINKYPILKTMFYINDSTVKQVINPNIEIKISSHDIQKFSEKEKDTYIETIKQQEVNYCFDLLKGPLLRVILINLGNNSCGIFLSSHHLIFDGKSIIIFFKNMIQYYEYISRNKITSSETIKFSYRDYINWEQHLRKTKKFENNLNYWKKYLINAKMLSLPADKQKIVNELPTNSFEMYTIPHGHVINLRKICSNENVTIFILLHAIFSILLCRYTCQNDINIAVPFANRVKTEFEDLIGLFANILVLRQKIDVNILFKELLRQCKRSFLNAHENQRVPSHLIAMEIASNHSANTDTIFNVMFNYIKMPILKTLELSVRVREIPSPVAKFDLYLLVLEVEDDLEFKLEYNSDMFEQQTMKTMLEDFNCIVEYLCRDYDKCIKDIMSVIQPKKLNLVISSTFVCEPIKPSLDFLMQDISIKGNIEFSPYNQVIQQLISPQSELLNNLYGANFLLIRLEDWIKTKRNPIKPLSIDNFDAIRLYNNYSLPNGQMVAYLNKNELDFLYKEIFQDNTYFKYGISIKDDACVFDIGANIGMFSLLVSCNLPNANIFAFEPVPKVFEILSANVKAYNLNVKLFNNAVSDFSGEKIFTHYPKSSLQSGYYADMSEDSKILKSSALQQHKYEDLIHNENLLNKIIDSKLEIEKFSCKCITLSDVIKQYEIQKIDLLKIDVEKSEFDVLNGIEEKDWDKIEQVVVEVHDNTGKLNSIIELLTKHGFILNKEQCSSFSNTEFCMLYGKKQSNHNCSFSANDHVEEFSEFNENVNIFLDALKNLEILPVPNFISITAISDQIKPHGYKWNSLKELEKKIISKVSSLKNIYYLDLSNADRKYKVPTVNDNYSDKFFSIPYTLEYFTAISAEIIRNTYSYYASKHKVIIVDCDNTLWGGVCAEDGQDKLVLTHSHKKFQKFLYDRKKEGFLLALCSKNSEVDVFNVFEHLEGMVLKQDDFVLYRINWDEKSDNIKSIIKELNLALDSAIFLDDSALECAKINNQCPEIITIVVNHENEEICTVLENCWLFDKFHVTLEDKNRLRLYLENKDREIIQKSSINMTDFIQNLNLSLAFSLLSDQHISRISQLTMRTTQFNMTLVKRTEAEINKLIVEQNRRESLVVSASDRFGDYGIVGFIVICIVDSTLEIDTFLLSCRALGRRIEYQMLSRIANEAVKKKCDYIKITFTHGSRNTPAMEFLQKILKAVGETLENNSVYVFKTSLLIMLEMSCFEDDIVISPVIKKNEEINNFKGGKYVVNALNSKMAYRISTQLNSVDNIRRNIELKSSSHLRLTSPYIAPYSKIQEQISLIWAEVLGISKVGIHDDFFELGGHSLFAVQIISRIKNKLGIELPITYLFEVTTVEKLDNAIKALKQDNIPHIPKIVSIAREKHKISSWGTDDELIKEDH